MKLQSAMSEGAIVTMLSLAASTPPGDFAEVGVWRGGSAQRLYELAQTQKRELHLFDTFTGIPWKSVYDVHNVGDFSDANLLTQQEKMPNAHFYIGTFPNTLPDSNWPSWVDFWRLAFVHEDTDQYASTKAVIDHLYPLLVPGGIMLFDDYATGDCPGSRKAIQEAGFDDIKAIGHHAFVRKPL